MVTWPVVSTALVLLAAGLMLVWYERQRPSARTVALVAAMAALAVVGRIAFAPIPNVKPTTDLVLLAGLAFGAVPGFAVGATTALVSNIVFGQGLHTPWQMLAWGGVGVLGALVARALGPRPGRVPIAAVCAAAGLAFGAFMDLSIWATVGGQHTLEEYVVIAVRSLPFNLAHAGGNAVFALAFAPAVLAALGRAAARSQVVIRPLPVARAATLLLALVVVLGVGGGVAAPAAQAAKRPIDYLLAQQKPDGGFGVTSSSVMESGWAAMAIGATPGVPASARRRVATYLQRTAQGLTDPGDLERTILALRAVGAAPRDAAGRDLVAALLAKQKADGSFAGLVNQTAFAILALRAAGRSSSSAPVKQAAKFLLLSPSPDGGFSYSGKGGGGVDDTAGVIQALVAAGRGGSPVTKRAVAFLRSKQVSDGGFTLSADGRSNAQSTAWATQALIAAGRNPARVKTAGNSPLRLLRSLTVADGHVRYSRASDQTPLWVTAQAQLALAGTPLPVRRASAASTSAAATPAVRAQRRAERRERRAARRERRAKRTAKRLLLPTAIAVLMLSREMTGS